MKTAIAWALSIGVSLCSSHLLVGQDSEKRLSEEERAKLMDEHAKSFFRFSVLANIINDKQVTDDLQVVGSQKNAIKIIVDEFNDKLNVIQFEYMEEERALYGDRSLSAELKELEFKQLQTQLAKHYTPITQEAVKKIETELLPHQFERLNQLVNQMASNRKPYSMYAGLINLFAELEVPDDKQAEVKKELIEIQKEYEKRAVALQKKYQQELVKRLPDDVRETFGTVFKNDDQGIEK